MHNERELNANKDEESKVGIEGHMLAGLQVGLLIA